MMPGEGGSLTVTTPPRPPAPPPGSCPPCRPAGHDVTAFPAPPAFPACTTSFPSRTPISGLHARGDVHAPPHKVKRCTGISGCATGNEVALRKAALCVSETPGTPGPDEAVPLACHPRRAPLKGTEDLDGTTRVHARRLQNEPTADELAFSPIASASSPGSHGRAWAPAPHFSRVARKLALALTGRAGSRICPWTELREIRFCSSYGRRS